MAGPAIKQIAAIQLVGEGHVVGGLAALIEVDHHAIDDAMGLGIEVVGLQCLTNRDDSVTVKQQRSDDGLLRLQVMGQHILAPRRHLDGRNHRRTSSHRDWIAPSECQSP